MPTAQGPRSRANVPLAVVAGVAFVGLCARPYASWWSHPSLFDDDFLRVGSLRRTPLAEALFRPFNEHMAPLFELVSWAAWVGAGRRVLGTPLAFQAASFLAFGLAVALVAAWTWREARSTTATLAAVAGLVLSSVSAECVLWYSASSFTWAASAMLAACLAASFATASPGRRGRVGWTAGAALAALLAPAFSAIGVLAGSLAAVRIGSSVDRPMSLARRSSWACWPLVGTAGYLLLGERFRYRELVSASVRHDFHPLAALWASARAPAAVLVPALLGLPERSAAVPGPILAGLGLLGLIGAAVWAARSRLRPLILVALAFVVGGYLATYATRARPGDPWIFSIQRYHLFPQIGLVGLVAAAIAPRAGRCDGGPARGWFAAACLAGGLALVQDRGMADAARAFRFADQPRVLEAAGRLERACERDGITLAQAMRSLEPIRTPWYPRPWPFNPLLHLWPPGPTTPTVAEADVRATLLARLSPEDRESVFGGMDATGHARPESDWAGPISPVEARELTPPGRPARRDFLVDLGTGDGRAIGLAGFAGPDVVEVCWADDREGWSTGRSFLWSPGESGRAVDFGWLPHWRRGEVRRVRVRSRDGRPVGAGSVRFLR